MCFTKLPKCLLVQYEIICSLFGLVNSKWFREDRNTIKSFPFAINSLRKQQRSSFSTILFCGVAFILCSSNALLAQNEPANTPQDEFIDDGHRGFHMSVYLMAPSSGGDRDRDYNVSPGIDFDHQFSERWGALLQMNWHFGPTAMYLPLHLGPKFVFQRNGITMTSLHAGIGPSAVVGNDYGSFFASANVGIRNETKLYKNNKVIFGVNYNIGMLGHSGDFTLIDILVGFRFF